MTTTSKGKRVLKVKRLSNDTDESTSIRRQDEHIDAWTASMGATIVGDVVDVDVSGTVSPFDRDSFGPWLTDERAAEYDVIAAIKIDRLRRSLVDFVKLIEWADERGIAIVAFQDGIDTSTPTGKLIAKLLAVFAEFERERIRERSMDAQRDALRYGWWYGGTPPFGYLAVKGADAKWRLTPDPDYVMPDGSLVVREIVRRVVAGDSLNSIAYDLNAAGVPTSEDRHRERTGLPVGPVRHLDGCPDVKTPETGRSCDCPNVPYRWSGTNIDKVLRSRAIMGETPVSVPVLDDNGRPFPVLGDDGEQTKDRFGRPAVVLRVDVVRDETGMPVRRAEPLISEREWERVIGALDGRKITPRRSRQVSPLSGLLICGVCGLPMYRFTDNRGVDRYRCKTAAGKAENGDRCGMTSIRATYLSPLISDALMRELGSQPVTHRVFVKGADHTRELEQVQRAVRELRDDADAGLFPDRADYRRRMSALLARQAQLETLPNEPDRWVDEPTGETYADRWQAITDDTERRDFLMASGLRFEISNRLDGRGGSDDLRLVRLRRVGEPAIAAPVKADLYGPDGQSFTLTITATGVVGTGEESHDGAVANVAEPERIAA